MAPKTKSRWADDEETSTAVIAQRKKEKEEKRQLREEKARRQQEVADAATRTSRNGTATDDDGPPPKRRRTSDPQTPSKVVEGAHILEFPARSFGACRDVNLYELLNNIEEGSYGFVSRARHKSSGEIVALKRLKLEHTNDGFPVTGLREIQTLKACEHQHIVHLHEVVVGNNLQDVYLVLDFIEHDLKTLLEDNPEPFLPSETKTLMHQLLSATAYLHEHHILHRDLKTSNLLLNNRGEIKVADFGMARYTSDPPPPNLTQLVVTLWYRAPELLLGATSYGAEIDVWSVGCIFAELLTREPLLPGKNEVDQLSLIFGLVGPPTNETWSDFRSLPNAKALHPILSSTKQQQQPQRQQLSPSKFPYLTAAGLQLLSSLLSLDPRARPTASAVLTHRYFREDPRPKPREMFPTFPSRAGQEHRRRRRKATPDAPVRGRAPPRLTAEDFRGVFGASDGDGGEGEGEEERRDGAGFALRLG